MNTKINYRYGHGHGFADREETVIVKGVLQWEQLKPYLKDENQFIAQQVGLPELNGKDVEEDSPWHELVDLELTAAERSLTLQLSDVPTASELLEKFKQAHEQGWNEMQFYADIANQAAEACNRFVVQVPEALINTAEFEVIMQSSEFGDETFKHFSLELAFETILRLYAEALKFDDGVERTIGLVLGPRVQDESDDVVTVFRGHTNNQSFKVKLNDFSFAGDKLAMGDPEQVTEANEYVFSDVDNFDLIKTYLKQNELLVFGENKKTSDEMDQKAWPLIVSLLQQALLHDGVTLEDFKFGVFAVLDTMRDAVLFQKERGESVELDIHLISTLRKAYLP